MLCSGIRSQKRNKILKSQSESGAKIKTPPDSRLSFWETEIPCWWRWRRQREKEVLVWRRERELKRKKIIFFRWFRVPNPSLADTLSLSLLHAREREREEGTRKNIGKNELRERKRERERDCSQTIIVCVCKTEREAKWEGEGWGCVSGCELEAGQGSRYFYVSR